MFENFFSPIKKSNDDESKNGFSTPPRGGGTPEGGSPKSPSKGVLEGKLMVRKGRSSGHGSIIWRERYVYFSFAEGGSVSVYEDTPESIKRIQREESGEFGPQTPTPSKAYTKIHLRMSAKVRDMKQFETSDTKNVLVFIPARLPWRAIDCDGSQKVFAIEIPTRETASEDLEWGGGFHMGDDLSVAPGQGDDAGSVISYSDQSIVDDPFLIEAEDDLKDEISSAKKKGKPFRIYFKCHKRSNEKALWLDAFDRIGRLARNTHKQKRFVTNFKYRFRKVTSGRSRMRTSAGQAISAEANRLQRHESLDLDDDSQSSDPSNTLNTRARLNQYLGGKPMQGNIDREFKVIPAYAYPHKWLTIPELYNEMMLPSTRFHDLRDPSRQNEEIGSLRVEVLQCVDIPKLDRASDTDAVVYLVCGSNAFSTDVIPDRTNPMWLRKSQRACIFPIYHGYARLYVGVFDDDGAWAVDDFAGRCVLNIAQLRPSSTYDVTIPLRMSSHLYSRRKRGAIRLRFTVDFHSEKDVLQSYIPKKIRFFPPQKSKPDVSTTIACADAKAFRNIAITIHGIHMPDRFTFPKIKSCLREINFTRKYVINDGIIQEIKDIRKWVNPQISAFVWCAWMHCIYSDRFSYVPGYIMLFIVLQLIRTYAKYAVDRPISEGFIPPTLEELVRVFLSPRTEEQLIEPMEMGRREEFNATKSYSNLQVQEYMYTKTHEPMGRPFFKALGFTPRDDSWLEGEPLHLEFPFGNGTAYPRMTVREALCLAEGDQEEGDDDEEDQVAEIGSLDDSLSETPNDKRAWMRKTMKLQSSDLSEFSEFESLHDLGSSVLDEGYIKEVSNNSEKAGDSEDSDEDEEDEVEKEPSQKMGKGDDHDEPEMHDDSSRHSASHASIRGAMSDAVNLLTHPTSIIRDQDMDWRNPDSAGKSIPDELQKTKNKMHELLYNNFNDRCYHIKNRNAVYFGEASRARARRKRAKNVDKKLDKLLGIKEYSSGNPIISRLSQFVEPIMGIVIGYLSAFRAGFNVFTWQDPYLTFWVFIMCLSLSIIFFLMPWRIVLFAAGMGLVGPQNWAIRVMREKGILPPLKPKKHKDTDDLCPQQQLVYGHKRLDGMAGPKPPESVDPLEVHHVVVPYGPFNHQRFYDWPPEQQYSTVTPTRKQIPVLNDIYRQDLSTTTLCAPAKDLHADSQKSPGPFPRLRGLRNRFRKQSGEKSSQELSQILEVPSEFQSAPTEKQSKNE